MKHNKSIRIIISLAIAIFCILLLSACNSKHKHTFSSEWSSDETYHYHVATCKHTNEISNKEKHIWDDGTVTTSATHSTKGERVFSCTVCGKTKTQEIDIITEHTFDKEVIENEYLKSTATCESKAVYYKSCSCGEKGTTTFEYGEALGHNWNNPVYEWSNDLKTCTATRICINDPNHKEIETVNVTYSVTQEQSCEDVELSKLTAKFENSAFVTQIKENVKTKDALIHNYEFNSFIWNIDNTCNAKTICANCLNEELITAIVTYEVIKEANCNESGNGKYKAKVTINGIDYEDSKTVLIPIDPTKHNFVEFGKLLPNCLEDGHESGKECSLCHHKEGGSVLPATGHNFIGDFAPYDENHHFKTCKNCHEKQICDCNFSEDFKYNETSHYNECIMCGNKSNIANHTYDDGKCTICNQLDPNACSHNYIDSYDSHSHYKICEFCLKIDEETRINHTYDQENTNGIYLKTEATCTNKAIYYYSCICGAKGIETFVFGESLGHLFGEPIWIWTIDGESYKVVAKFTCTRDSNHVESVNSTVTSVITIVPTCNMTGKKTFMATVIKNNVTYTDTKIVELAVDPTNHFLVIDERVEPTCTTSGHKAGEHCENCDYKKVGETIPALGHNYTGIFVSSDDTHHSHKCSRCDAIETIECEFSNTYSYDENTHFYVCNECGNKKNISNHLYVDDICSACGQKDPNACEHHYINSYNETHHYEECEHCGKINEATKIAHNYDQLIVDNIYLKENATCTSLAKYYKSCTCGAKGTETFEHGVKLDHDYTDKDWKILVPSTCTESGIMYKDCNECGEVGRITKEIDSIGHDWDFEKPIWVWENSEEGYRAFYRFVCLNNNEHYNDIEAIVEITSNIDATCITEGSITYTATVTIDSNIISDTKTIILSTNSDNHESNEFEYVINENNTHTAFYACCHVEYKTTAHTPNDDDGDCTTEIVCSKCGAVTKEAEDEHNYGDWEYVDDDIHSHRCTHSNCNVYETETHSGGNATCTEKAICDICNSAYGEALGHSYTNENADEVYHYCSVENCTGKEEHSFDNKNVCIVCNYELPYTANLLFTLLENNTYMVSKGTAIAQDVVIPSTYKGVSVTKIDNAGFSGYNMRTVIIPDSITIIGDEAFNNTNLESVMLPLQLSNLGNNAFKSTTKLFYQKEEKEFTCSDVNINIYYYAENNPQENGKYWYYDNETITIWTKCELVGHTISGGYSNITEDTHTFYCSECKEYITEEHICFSEIVNSTYLKTPATCTDAAVYHYMCKCSAKCHETFTAGDPLGHNYGDIIEVQAMTCTDDQILEKTCKREECGHVEQIINKALGHYYIESKWFSSDDGHYHKCENCDHETDIIAHTPNEEEGIIQTPATCSQEGELLCYCTVCNHEVILAIETINHTYDAWGHSVENHWHKCSECNDVLEESIESHNLEKIVSEEFLFESATCTTKAKYYKSCECGYCPFDEEEIFENGEILGHLWDESNPVWNWSEDGLSATVTYICTRDHEHIDEINADVELKSTVPSTCVLNGNKIYTGLIIRNSKTITDDFEIELPLDSNNHNADEEYHAETGDLAHYHICLDCAEIIESSMEAHSWNEGEVTQNPTCTDYGIKEFTCSVCGLTYTNKIAKIDHSISVDWDYNKDYHWHNCDDCNEMIDETKHSHNWDLGLITQEPSCYDYGIKTYTCSVCGGTKEEQIEMIAHAYNNLYYYDGVYHYEKCDNCDHYDIETAQTHNHVDGYCSICGQPDPSSCEHHYSNSYNDTYHYEECEHCRKINEATKIAHNLVLDNERITQATCSSFGENVYTCVCGYEKYEQIDKLDHIENDEYWETNESNHFHICSECYEIIESSIESHEWINELGEITIQPTCTQTGEKLFVCETCGYEKYVEIPSLGHQEDPNLETNSYMHYHLCTVCNEIVSYEYHTYSIAWSNDNTHHWHECSVCNAIEDEKEEHLFNQEDTNNIYLASLATCTTKATYYYSCKCGAIGSETFEYGECLGHNYDDQLWIETKAPTCVELGSHYKDCVRCHEAGRIVESIPLTNHSYQVSYTNNSTEHWHECSVCHAIEDEPIEHIYDQMVISNEYLVSDDIQCGEHAIYYYSCVCGQKGYSSFETGAPLEHDYEHAIKTDECYHYCPKCNEYEEHDFGTDNVCDTCGYVALYTLGLSYSVSENDAAVTGVGAGNGFLTKIVIPSLYQGKEVVAIFTNAFRSNSNIEEIVLPSTIIRINGGAFSGCTNLQKINLTNVRTIESNVFENCTSLQDIVLSNNLTTINDSLFAGLTNLRSIVIPNGVTTIGNYAFDGCTSLTNITLPNTVTSILSYAFSGCAFETIKIPDGVKRLNSNIFQNCTNLKSVTIPEGVTTINEYAFDGCTSLETITLPSTLKTLATTGYQFKDCTSLYSVIFEEGTTITSIPEKMFIGCSSLLSIDIPNTVTKIGAEAFNGCTNLSDVTISNSTTTINKKAFLECSSLTNIVIPNSVVTIGTEVFKGCTNLEKVVLSTNLTNLTYAMFSNCSNLRSLIVPENITTIDNGAIANTIEKIFYLGSSESLTYNHATNKNKVYYYSESVPIEAGAKQWRYVDEIPLVWNTCELGNHLYDQEVIDTIYLKTPATCTSGAIYYLSCTCGEKGGHEHTFIHGSPLGHNTKNVYEFSNDYSTCTASQVCLRCGEVLAREVVNTTSHIIYYQSCEQEEIVVFRATFENENFSEHQSGYVKTKDAKSHTYDKEIVNPKYLKSLADCEHATTYYRSCECGHFIMDNENVFTNGVALGHSLGSWVAALYKVSDASCTSPAIYNKSCSRCEHISEETFEYGKALGHIGDWIITTQATCEEEGLKTRTCTRCNEEEHFAIPALGHAFSGWSITKAATCEEAGIETRSCQHSGCTETQTREIPALGHQMTDWNEVIPATCITSGILETHCSREECTHHTTKSIPALGHNWGNSVNLTEWSCTQDQIREQTCSTCGTKRQIVVPAKEHLYAYGWLKDEYSHYHATTCGCDLIKDREAHSFNGNSCSVCGYTKTNETPVEMPSVTSGLSNSVQVDHTVVKAYDAATSSVLVFPGLFDDKPVHIGGLADINSKRDLVTTVYIQEGATKILDNAFADCINLTYVYIPDSVTEIGMNAFKGCVNLRTVRMSNNVTLIKTQAFNNCTKLTNIKMPNSIQTIGSFAFANTKITKLEFPNSILTIDQNAFANCKNLSSITFELVSNSDGRGRNINQSAFEGCSSLTSVILPKNLGNLSNNVFKNCTALTRIIFNDNLISIGNNTFEGCISLTNIVLPNNLQSIGIEAFKGCSALTSVDFNSSLKTIDERAFYECNLRTVIIPEGSVITIKNEAFYGNNSIDVVSIQAVSSSYSCFSDNSILTFNGSWSSLKQLGNQKTSLKKVEINGMSGIEIANIFKGYTNLEVVVFDRVTSIPSNAFNGCTGLKTLSFNGNLIGESAFEGCIGLKTVYLSGNVNIGTNAFKGCSNITTLVINDYRATFTNTSFANCNVAYAIIPNSMKSNISKTNMVAAVYKNASDSVVEIYE